VEGLLREAPTSSSWHGWRRELRTRCGHAPSADARSKKCFSPISGRDRAYSIFGPYFPPAPSQDELRNLSTSLRRGGVGNDRRSSRMLCRPGIARTQLSFAGRSECREALARAACGESSNRDRRDKSSKSVDRVKGAAQCGPEPFSMRLANRSRRASRNQIRR